MEKQAYRWVLIFGLLGMMALAYPLCQWLTPKWGWENGVLEWAQVLILAGITALSVFFAGNAQAKNVKNFWVLIAALMAMLVLRELSWGAVLFPPVEVGSHGPQFLSRKELPYGAFIHPMLGLFLITWVFLAFKLKVGTLLLELIKSKRFPVVEIALTLAAIFLSSAFEQEVFQVSGDQVMVIEEYLETLFYIGIFLAMSRLNYLLTGFSRK